VARRFLCQDGYLPGFLYRMVSRCLPVVSVEGMIVRDGRVLLLRRRFSPARGEWWFPGGRVRWGEGFFDVLPGGLHRYLLEVVRDSGWRRGGGVGV
jgi:hypothetical protein